MSHLKRKKKKGKQRVCVCVCVVIKAISKWVEIMVMLVDRWCVSVFQIHWNFNK